MPRTASRDGTPAYELRWFTPATEIDLCCHATLAAAFVVMTRLVPAARAVRFESPRSGTLAVTRTADRALTLDFPASPPQPTEAPATLVEALGRAPRELLRGSYWLAVFGDRDEVAALAPDTAALRAHDPVIATAPGREVDFVSRFFAPSVGVDEDPVTGSAHCVLAPYWAARLGKDTLAARQISPRGGELTCRLAGERVEITGHAVLVLEGALLL